MTKLKEQLEEKRGILYDLMKEIRDLENLILQEEWKDQPECTHTYYAIRDGKCPHGDTIRGIVYCKNPNCHK